MHYYSFSLCIPHPSLLFFIPPFACPSTPLVGRPVSLLHGLLLKGNSRETREEVSLGGL